MVTLINYQLYFLFLVQLAFIFITNVHAVDDIGIDFADEKLQKEMKRS